MRRATPRRRLHVAVTDAAGRRLTARGLADWLARTAPTRARGTVAIALVGDHEIRRLNRTFRGIDAATDVLSFPAGPTSHARGPVSLRPRPTSQAPSPKPVNHLGDLAIALGVARRQARTERHALSTELKILALHGLLHLLGYDHERDRGAMKRLEDRLRRRAGLPPGLVTRTPGPTARR